MKIPAKYKSQLINDDISEKPFTKYKGKYIIDNVEKYIIVT